MKKFYVLCLSILLIFPLQIYADENTTICNEDKNEEVNSKTENEENHGIVTYGPGWIEQ